MNWINIFSRNSLDCCHPSCLKDVPVVKAFDSFEVITRISNTADTSSAKIVSDDIKISSDDIAYYGKNPVILSASKIDRRQYTQSPEYYCPIGVIFDIEQLLDEKRIRNIYPFDPSDFQVSHNGKQINNFQINRSLEGIGKYIVYFFVIYIIISMEDPTLLPAHLPKSLIRFQNAAQRHSP